MIRAFVLALTALALGACATLSGVPEGRYPLVVVHRARAHAAEKDGRLRRALDEWRIVRAIDPSDTTASAGQARVQTRITRLVAERLAEGKAALAHGSQIEARRKLLAALALDPGNREAFTLLQTRVHDVDFVMHAVNPGDTLASLAERYYGDRSRSEVIWETNRLPANPRLTAGMLLRIPAIPGVPFVRAPRPEATDDARASSPSPPEVGQESEVNPLIAEAREALDRADYVGALGDLDKLLASDPANREGLDLKKAVLYRHGRALFDQKSYEESYRTFGQLARMQRDYEDVLRLLREAKAQVAERHYREGIRLYREEHLKEAITEWRTALALEPGHASARKNIEQAEKLLQSLEELQKK